MHCLTCGQEAEKPCRSIEQIKACAVLSEVPDQMPDYLPNFDKDGNITGHRPNYAKPGIVEEMEKMVDIAERLANPARSSLDYVIMNRIERLRAERRSN